MVRRMRTVVVCSSWCWAPCWPAAAATATRARCRAARAPAAGPRLLPGGHDGAARPRAHGYLRFWDAVIAAHRGPTRAARLAAAAGEPQLSRVRQGGRDQPASAAQPARHGRPPGAAARSRGPPRAWRTATTCRSGTRWTSAPAPHRRSPTRAGTGRYRATANAAPRPAGPGASSTRSRSEGADAPPAVPTAGPAGWPCWPCSRRRRAAVPGAAGAAEHCHQEAVRGPDGSIHYVQVCTHTDPGDPGDPGGGAPEDCGQDEVSPGPATGPTSATAASRARTRPTSCRWRCRPPSRRRARSGR